MTDVKEISYVIHNNYEEINKICSPRSGDCGSVAYALQDIYSGELIGVYANENARLPKHILVQIEGEYFDIDGLATKNQIYEEYLIHYTSNDNIDDLFIPESEKTISSVMFNENIISKIKNIIN